MISYRQAMAYVGLNLRRVEIKVFHVTKGEHESFYINGCAGHSHWLRLGYTIADTGKTITVWA